MVCQVCGKEIEKTTWNKKYCSVECKNRMLNQKRAKPQRPAEIAICQFCGKEFKKNVASRRYCSDECARSAALEQMKKAKHSENYATCPICGNRFRKKGASRFCSDECRNACYDKTPVQKVCICCGKTFIPKRSNVIFVRTSADTIEKKHLKTRNLLHTKQGKVFQTSPRRQKWRECHTGNTSKQWKGGLYDKFR